MSESVHEPPGIAPDIGNEEQPQPQSTEPVLAVVHAPESGMEPEHTPASGLEEPKASAVQQLPLEPEPIVERTDAEIRAIVEAIVYVTDEPLTLDQIVAGLAQPLERVKAILDELTADFNQPQHGLSIQEVAGGYKMATKPEHHEAVRQFVRNLKPPLKLSMPALETLAVIAYKQPITAPEIMEIRGVQGAGVLKTLLDRKLIAAAGRKNVVGKPILYKTTREFLVQFGLKDLNELPSLKEFEEIRRMALSDDADAEPLPAPDAQPEAGPHTNGS